MTSSKKSNAKNTKVYIYALGRRKSAIATIKLFKGKGETIVNGKALEVYFPSISDKLIYTRPFTVTSTEGKFYYISKVIGGGKSGQLEAVVLAISRALKKLNEENGPILRQNGLLTVDSRVRQRRMVGKGGKSRRQKQSPKR